MAETLVKRSDKVAFMGCLKDGSETFNRMTGFTSLSKSANPSEYSRRYVDEDQEQTDVTGYSPSFGYGFDQYIGNPVHEEIVDISDNEKLGTNAVRNIIVVDKTQKGSSENSYKAVSRPYAIIADGEGDSTDAYTYSGNLKVKGERITGSATSTDNWKTITFTKDTTVI